MHTFNFRQAFFCTLLAFPVASGCAVKLKTVDEVGRVLHSEEKPENQSTGPIAIDATAITEGVYLRMEDSRNCRVATYVIRETIRRRVPETKGAVAKLWGGTAVAAGLSLASFALAPDEGIDVTINGDDAGTIPWFVVLTPVAFGLGGTAAVHQVRMGLPVRGRTPLELSHATPWERCPSQPLPDGTLDVFLRPVGSEASALISGQVVDGTLKFQPSILSASFWRIQPWESQVYVAGVEHTSKAVVTEIPVTGELKALYDLAAARERAEMEEAANRKREAAKARAERKAADEARRAALTPEERYCEDNPGMCALGVLVGALAGSANSSDAGGWSVSQEWDGTYKIDYDYENFSGESVYKGTCGGSWLSFSITHMSTGYYEGGSRYKSLPEAALATCASYERWRNR